MGSSLAQELETIESVLAALCDYDERDEAIMHLVEAIEDDRAKLIAVQIADQARRLRPES